MRPRLRAVGLRTLVPLHGARTHISALTHTIAKRHYAAGSSVATTRRRLRTRNRHEAAFPLPPQRVEHTIPTISMSETVSKPPVQPSTTPPMVPAKISGSKNTTIPILKPKKRVNPPQSSYAPKLTVPARKHDQSIFSYYWNAGRAYLDFYKTGISNVRESSKTAKELRKIAEDRKVKDMSEVLSRAEWQMVRRSRRDILRLPAFGALIMLLGEWLPLVVLYITPVIPEACRIPQQVERDLRKMEDRRQDRLRRVSLDATRLMMKDRRPSGQGMNINMDSFQKNADHFFTSESVRVANPNDMTLFELVLFSAIHDCHWRIWDWLHLTPPKMLLRRSVGRKLDYLRKDDELIERDGGWASLSPQEVKRACVERGIPVIGKSGEDWRRALAGQWVGGSM